MNNNLIKFNNVNEDLFFWIKNYISSKIYVLSATRGKKELYEKNRERIYTLVINSNNINELDSSCKEAIKYGLYGLRVYINPLVQFYNFIETKKAKKLLSLKSINTNLLNSYTSIELDKLKDDTKRSYYNQLRSLFKFIDEKSIDDENFKFKIGFLLDGTKIKLPIKNTIEKKFRYLEPEIFERFIESIGYYKSKREDSYNQKLMVKIFCFGGLRSVEARFIKKSDCSIKTIKKDRYLQIFIHGKGGYQRCIYIKYNYIKNDYEKSLEFNQKCEFLFYTKDFKQYEEKSVYTLIDRFYRNANIDSTNLGIHALRSSFATYLHSKGVSLDTVITLLGHVDNEVQNLYVYPNNDGLKKIPKLFENL